MTSAVPISVAGGARKLTWPEETKKICAARPLTVTVVPETFVGKVPFRRRCDCSVVLARLLPRAIAMLFGATALIADGSFPHESPSNMAVNAPKGGRAAGAVRETVEL